jgi:O-antigen ligase
LRVVSVASGELSSEARRVVVTPAGVLRIGLLLLAISGLGAIPLLNIGSREAPLFVNDILAMATVAVGMIAMRQAHSLKFDDVAIVAFAFVLVGGGSAIAAIPRFGLNTMQLIGSLAYLVRWVVYLLVYVVIINSVRERDIGPLWNALETAMLAFAAFGVFQSIFLPDFGLMIYPDARRYKEIDPQGHRLVSTILEPNIAAAMILCVLLVQLAQLASGVPVKRWKPTLLLVALILTLSRSGVVGFAAGMTVILLARGLGTKLVRYLMGVGAAIVLASPAIIAFANQYAKFNLGATGSIPARILVWQRAILTWWENPWVGVGFNTYGYVQEQRGIALFGSANYSAEGGLLFVAVMTGAVGLVLYLVMLWLVFRRCRRVWRHPLATANERGLSAGAAAATVAILTHSVFVNSLLVPFVMLPLWALWGFAFLQSRALRERALQPAS